MPDILGSAIREAERVAQEQSNELTVEAGADLAAKTASVEIAAQKKFGSKFIGSVWAKYVAKPGRDDAAVGVTGRILFGQKEK